MERKPSQPSNYQLTLENADLQPFGVRSTLVLAAMSCPYAHSPSCFQKGSTQMDTLLDSLHRPHAYLPKMVPPSSNMEHSTPTSTGHQKVPRPPTASTHDGLLLTHPDQQYWDSQHATNSES